MSEVGIFQRCGKCDKASGYATFLSARGLCHRCDVGTEIPRHSERPYVEIAVKVWQDDELIHPDIVRDDLAEVLARHGYAFTADWIATSPHYPIAGRRAE